MTLFYKWLFVLAIVAITGQKADCAKYKTIQTRLGAIKGILVDVPAFSTSVYQFRGIPYAKPPVGRLRFRKPKPIKKWTSVLDATEYGPLCPQRISSQFDIQNRNLLLTLLNYPNKNMSEDCLFLNIFVPQNTCSWDKKSVMIYIHGGSYILGAGTGFDGSYLSSYGDVIIVTINYRLGFLGFMSTMDTASRGNYGLWDQHLAIKWVKDNIAHFGGNPLSITIFGESAGGYSVGFQSLYSGNKGLFQNAIAKSGVANPIPIARHAREVAIGIGRFAGCNYTKNSLKLVKCLRRKSYNELLDASDNAEAALIIGKELNLIFYLGPTIDHEFIEDDPSVLLKDQTTKSNKFFRSLNLIVGYVNAEGSLLKYLIPPFERVYNFNYTQGVPTRFLCDGFAAGLANYHFSNNTNVSRAICNFYKVPGGNNVAMKAQARNAVKLFGDFLFYKPGLVFADAHQSPTKNTFLFMFSMPGKFGYGEPYPGWFQGAGHSSELAYLFGIQKLSNLPKEHYDLSLQMLKYWTNFAKTGNPNGYNTDVTWPRYSSSTQPYLDLNYPISQKNYIFKKRMKFWHETIPAIINPPRYY